MNASSEQIKAARVLLGWTGAELGQRANIAQSTVCTIEGGIRLSGSAIARMKAIMEASGVEFMNGGQPGVRMKATSGP